MFVIQPHCPEVTADDRRQLAKLKVRTSIGTGAYSFCCSLTVSGQIVARCHTLCYLTPPLLFSIASTRSFLGDKSRPKQHLLTQDFQTFC